MADSGTIQRKDPDSTLDYTIDWTAWLGTDTISTSTWTIGSGLTKQTDTKTSKTATVWLTGGTAGTDYTATNRIVTVGGRTDERSMRVQVRQR